MYFLFHFKSKLELELELQLELQLGWQLEFASKLVFELPYRVANAELLAVEVEDAYCIW